MATPKPGEIRCPTCHRSTPPAAFCTQCGSAIPTDARIRPRGMDRDELQERIRARRSGGEPYRRGGTADDDPAYERFEPEPEDARIQRGRRADAQRPDHLGEGAAAAAAAGAAAESPARGDLTRDRDDWTAPVVPPPADARGAEPAYEDQAYAETVDAEPAPYAQPEHIDAYEDGYADPYAEYPYEYDRYEDSEQRSSGAGAFAILGFLALGVLALFGGAVLAGVFGDDDPGVGSASPTPTFVESLAPDASDAPSVAPSVAPSGDGSAGPGGSGGPIATGEPVVFDDGAVFEVQACASNEMSFEGCAQEGEFFSGGSFVAWVGFNGASGDDTLLLVLRQNGAGIAEADFPLGRAPFGCTSDCTGYARQGFTGLPPGEYTLELLRNGEPAHGITIGVD